MPSPPGQGLRRSFTLGTCPRWHFQAANSRFREQQIWPDFPLDLLAYMEQYSPMPRLRLIECEDHVLCRGECWEQPFWTRLTGVISSSNGHSNSLKTLIQLTFTIMKSDCTEFTARASIWELRRFGQSVAAGVLAVLVSCFNLLAQGPAFPNSIESVRAALPIAVPFSGKAAKGLTTFQPLDLPRFDTSVLKLSPISVTGGASPLHDWEVNESMRNLNSMGTWQLRAQNAAARVGDSAVKLESDFLPWGGEAYTASKMMVEPNQRAALFAEYMGGAGTGRAIELTGKWSSDRALERFGQGYRLVASGISTVQDIQQLRRNVDALNLVRVTPISVPKSIDITTGDGFTTSRTVGNVMETFKPGRVGITGFDPMNDSYTISRQSQMSTVTFTSPPTGVLSLPQPRFDPPRISTPSFSTPIVPMPSLPRY